MANEPKNYKVSEVQVRDTPDGGYTQIGVEVDGAWFPFAVYKVAGFQEDLTEARERAAAEAPPPEPAA